jgi:adenylate kinase family enzyme
VVVIGSGGAGKTTFAAGLAGRLGVPHVELDALYWGPGWVGSGGSPENDARFRARILAATAGGAWVADGNYRVARGSLWPQADAIVWLDFPLGLVLRRIVRRTLSRLLTGEVLWGTNRESLRNALLARDSLLVYTARTHRRRRRLFAEQLARADLAHLHVARLRSPGEAGAWLARVSPAGEPGAVPESATSSASSASSTAPSARRPGSSGGATASGSPGPRGEG